MLPEARRTVRLWRTHLQHRGNAVVPEARRTVRLWRTYLQHRGIMSCQRHDVLEFVGYTDAELVVDVIKVATETDIGGKVLVKVVTHRCPY